jgi:hypothetical protein
MHPLQDFSHAVFNPRKPRKRALNRYKSQQFARPYAKAGVAPHVPELELVTDIAGFVT